MTDDELTEMACAAKLHHCMCVDIELPRLREFARMVAEAEREACAQMFETDAMYDHMYETCDAADRAAAAIRARKE